MIIERLGGHTMESRVGRWSKGWWAGVALGMSLCGCSGTLPRTSLTNSPSPGATNMSACPERTVRVCTSAQPLAGLKITPATYDCGCERWIDKL
jgi:hypothetical protein